jgi:hypothetical protein
MLACKRTLPAFTPVKPVRKRGSRSENPDSLPWRSFVPSLGSLLSRWGQHFCVVLADYLRDALHVGRAFRRRWQRFSFRRLA